MVQAWAPCPGGVFYDLGSNRGDTLTAWLGGKPPWPSLLRTVGSPFAPRSFCTHAVEPNPKFTTELRRIERHFKHTVEQPRNNGSLTVHVETAAVASTNSTVRLRQCQTHGAKCSSVSADFIGRDKPAFKDITVNALDFPGLLRSEVPPREDRQAFFKVPYLPSGAE